ncbi:MAG: hypothetical protein NT033_06475, partial [Candidatus Omnitrophica bacterium]|nr:hypothetical protein [Candidatus Omnitrophota bacterium]
PLVLQPPALTTPATTEKPKSDFDDLLARNQQVLAESDRILREGKVLTDKIEARKKLQEKYDELDSKLRANDFRDPSNTLTSQKQDILRQMNELAYGSPAPTPAPVTPKPVTAAGSTRLPLEQMCLCHRQLRQLRLRPEKNFQVVNSKIRQN